MVSKPASKCQTLFCRLMAVKSTLYKSSSSGQQRAADCHCQMMLNCIAVTFKSVLRPKAVNSMELVGNKIKHIHAIIVLKMLLNNICITWTREEICCIMTTNVLK